MFRWLLWAIAAAMRPRLLLIADNLCLRQQLLVLQRRKPRPRLNCARTAHPDPADDHGEPGLGPAQDPGGVGAAGVQSLRENDSQVYASNPPSRAVFPLAVIPEAACVGHLGVRLFLCPDHNV